MGIGGFHLKWIPVSKANGGAKSFKGPPRSLSEEHTHVHHRIFLHRQGQPPPVCCFILLFFKNGVYFGQLGRGLRLREQPKGEKK